MSLGSAKGANLEHAREIKALADIVQPAAISDHASWSASGNAHLNDLLPLPYDDETLSILMRNVSAVQDVLGREIWVENPSTYLSFSHSDRSEPEFLNALAKRTGCGLLLDVNNIFVQAHNHGFDARAYLDAIAPEAVRQYHLAGHTTRQFGGEELLIDTHNRPVREEVWELFGYAVARIGARPTLIEWDADLPSFGELLAQAELAERVLSERTLHAAA